MTQVRADATLTSSQAVEHACVLVYPSRVFSYYPLAIRGFNWLLNQKPRERPEGEAAFNCKTGSQVVSVYDCSLLLSSEVLQSLHGCDVIYRSLSSGIQVPQTNLNYVVILISFFHLGVSQNG